MQFKEFPPDDFISCSGVLRVRSSILKSCDKIANSDLLITLILCRLATFVVVAGIKCGVAARSQKTRENEDFRGFFLGGGGEGEGK